MENKTNYDFISSFMLLHNFLTEKYPEFIEATIKVVQKAVSLVIKFLLTAVKGELLKVWKENKGLLANLSQLSANAAIRRVCIFFIWSTVWISCRRYVATF